MASSIRLYGSWVDVASKGRGLLRFAGIEAREGITDGQYSAMLAEPVKQSDGVVAYQSRLVTVEPYVGMLDAPASLVVYDDGYCVEVSVPALEISSPIRIYHPDDSDGELQPAKVHWPSSGYEGMGAAAVAVMAQVLQVAAGVAAELDKAAGR